MMTGSEQLREWLKRARFNQREAATYLDLDETFLSQILNGLRRPSLTKAVILEERTGVPVAAWLIDQDGNDNRDPVNAGNPQADQG